MERGTSLRMLKILTEAIWLSAARRGHYEGAAITMAADNRGTWRGSCLRKITRGLRRDLEDR